MRNLSYILCFLFCASIAFIAFGRPLGFQWDFFAFYNAALSWRLGLNPYDFSELASKVALPRPPELGFTYPPLTILFFLPFSFLPQTLAAGVWVIVKCAFLAAMLWACQSMHRFDWRKPADMALLFFGFNSTLMSDFTTGNTSIPQFALVWLAFHFLERQREILFALFIALAAALKIQPIALLAAPLLLYRPMKWKPALAGLLFFSAFIGANALFYPELFSTFLRTASGRLNLENGILSPSALALCQDLMAQLSYVSVLPQSLQQAAPSFVVPLYFVLVLALGITALLTLRKYARTPDNPQLVALFSFFLLTYLLTIPRVKAYEFVLILPAAAYALGRMQPAMRAALLLLLCLPVVFPIGHSLNPEFYSPPQLGVIKKLQYLFYQYLPYWSALLLWLWFLRDGLSAVGRPYNTLARK